MLKKHIYEVTNKPEIGNKYHLSWASKGCVWKLVEICADNIYCYLQTPKSKKIIKAKIVDLRLLKPTAFNYKQN